MPHKKMPSRREVLFNLSGGPVPLRNIIDNNVGDAYVGLCEFTYVTGWYNVSEALGNNKFSYRPSSTDATVTTAVPDGYYNVDTLSDVITAVVPGFSSTINTATGRVILTLADPNYQLNQDILAKLWGFSTASWLGPAATYTADTTPKFFIKRNLLVVLDQINAANNQLNGFQSTLLRHIPTTGEAYGESRTVHFRNVEYCHLRGGIVNELTLRILDDNNTDISNLCAPFSATLEVRQ
jgi:hypothetical protein